MFAAVKTDGAVSISYETRSVTHEITGQTDLIRSSAIENVARSIHATRATA